MSETQVEIIKWSITTLVGIFTFYIARFWAKKDRNIARDIQTLDRLLALLPSTGSILFLRQSEFGNVFGIERLDGLVKFQDECLKTEFAFIDATLEKERKQLLKLIENFREQLQEVILNPIGYQPGVMRIRRSEDDPSLTWEEINKTIGNLEKMANEVCKIYDHLITSARRKL